MITTALIVRVPAPAASGYGKIYYYFCWGFRFGLGSLEHNFEGSGLGQVHCSKILLVQVRFGFTKMKGFIRVYGSGSGSVRHLGYEIKQLCDTMFWLS